MSVDKDDIRLAEDLIKQTEADQADTELINSLELDPVMVGGNHPLLMDDPDDFWLIVSGSVELFIVELEDGKVVGQRHHIATLNANEIMVGCRPIPLKSASSKRKLSLYAVAATDTRLFKGALTKLREKEIDLTMVVWVDYWVSLLSRANAKMFKIRAEAVSLEADPGQKFMAGEWVTSYHNNIVWVELKEGDLLYQGVDELAVTPKVYPITEWTTLQFKKDSVVDGLHSPTILIRGDIWDCLRDYMEHFLKVGLYGLKKEAEQFKDKFVEYELNDEFQIRNSLGQMTRFLQGGRSTIIPATVQGRRNNTIEVCQAIAHRLGHKLDVRKLQYDMQNMSLIDVLRRAGFYARKVKLNSGEWYKKDSGVLVAVKKEDDNIVALWADRGKDYCMYDVAQGGEIPFHPKMLKDKIYGQAYMLYRTLPGKIESLKDILYFGAREVYSEFGIIATLAVLAGLLGLLTPLVTGHILSEYIPDSDLPMIVSALAALFFAMLGRLTFGFVNFVSLTRIAGRMSVTVQSAVWGRLLQLPTEFFRKYTAGDMANRANGINEIREILTASTVSAFVAAISGLMNFVLMIYYSWRLSILAVMLVAVMSVITIVFLKLQLPHQRAIFKMQGHIDGLVFQILSGAAKLRVSGKENFGFARWADVYSMQKFREYRALSWQAMQAVVNSVFEPLSTIAMMVVIVYILLEGAQTSFDLTSYLAFNSAFGQFTGAMISMTATFATVIEVLPLYERVQPIMEEEPEKSKGNVVLSPMRGQIEFSKVWYSYNAEGESILKDISFSISPGDYVAFVGESGAGKSTICRLLLGFGHPKSGSIFVDEHDITELNIREFRRQTGVVLQGSQLLSGSILENIRSGLADLNQDAAWEAAEQAGLAQDIKDMPMGMHTVLPEGGIGLSGGQRQRLMIARALSRKPRLLVFDEATSSLDNISQAVVKKTLNGLNTTRIVIAHRLSTIRDVDRIYVMHKGRIVEVGKFQELIEKGGHFAELAKRQVL